MKPRALPESFFTVLSRPQITNLAELKVTLHVFWRLAAQDGQPRLLVVARAGGTRRWPPR